MTSVQEYKNLSKKIFDITWRKNASFYQDKSRLKGLINKILDEISQLEMASGQPILLKSQQIKAVWVLSGIGTYFEPITDFPGDQIYKDKPWGRWGDRERLDFAGKIVDSMPDMPYLIYNGANVQNEALIKATKNGFPVPLERIYFPKGKISCTIDQVKNLSLPKEIEGDNISLGIVSHAPHLARVVRMFNLYKPLSNVKLKLFPLPSPSLEFTQNEILGILDYVASGQATEDPFPFEL
jgi:hypothetical protein